MEERIDSYRPRPRSLGIGAFRQTGTARRRSLSVARAIYLHLPDGYKLWVRGRDFDNLDREALTEALA